MKPNVTIDTLISVEQIDTRVHELAKLIAADMSKDLMIVALLRGSFVFAADLIRALHLAGSAPQVDFMTLGSYGNAMESSGTITVIKDLAENVQGRDVLMVDDILESGRTLSFACNLVRERGAHSVKIATMLEKPGKRKVNIEADYVGFTIEDKFVVGYGLDYANYFRELPFIGVVTLV